MAGQLTANGMVVLRGRISMPRVGATHFDLELDGEVAPTGKLTITDGTVTFVATVLRGGPLGTRVVVRAVGGAGGLKKDVEAKHYVDVPLRLPVRDTLGDVGETLSPDSLAALLESRLGHWSRVGKTPAGSALSAVLEPAGASWRVLADGTVWVGVETWPTQKVAGLQELDPDPELGTFTIASDSLELRPGVTFLGRRVSRVEHQIEEGHSRTLYWAEDSATGASSALDRIKEPLARFIRFVMRDVKYHRQYPCEVVRQDSSTGLLDLYPDDESIRGKGTTGVQIRHGLPGIEVEVPQGARVLLGFDNGDPSKPYASLWESGSVTSVTFAGGTQSQARQGDLTMSGGPGTTVVLTPVTGVGALPNNAVVAGVPHLISFSVTPFPQAPLYGAIATGQPRWKS